MIIYVEKFKFKMTLFSYICVKKKLWSNTKIFPSFVKSIKIGSKKEEKYLPIYFIHLPLFSQTGNGKNK